MKRLFAAILAACLLCGLTACGGSKTAPESPTQPPEESAQPAEPEAESPISAQPLDPESPADPIEALVASMTLEEKVGQLFFSRCPAENAPQDAADYHLGGYILFGRDTKDKTANELIQSIARCQEAAQIPLFIGVDEEGGTVVRVSSNPHLRSAKFQSPQKLFAKGGMDAILADTHEKDLLLKALGFNLNLAPVADLSTNSGDFIYARSFGQDAAATSDYISAVVTQMADDRMGSVLKHFPGYGNNVDTHTGIAVDKRSREQFEQEDLLPFFAGIDAGAPCVLVSHNIVTCMDGDLPASLSPEVHRILRKELGFEGVVMTDDLDMQAIAGYLDSSSAAVSAIRAGNDLVLSSDYKNQIPSVLAAVADGTLDETIIDTACTRVLRCKAQLGILN